LLISTVIAGIALAGIAMIARAANATTLNFNNGYYVSSLSEFNSLFGSSTRWSSSGVYQETNPTTPTVTRLTSSGAPGV
jgi:hypothetical protein